MTEHDTTNGIRKFVKMLTGNYMEYPTQDEFGMALAYQASVRSNFPGGRHIGASILSSHGEVISVASIRAPSRTSSSNPTMLDQSLIQDGYNNFYYDVKKWSELLNQLSSNKEKNLNDSKKKSIKKLNIFIKNIIDFHPCTHAEIAAILDAAKLGVSVRKATLYTTTFPCHLCAKDIINSGITRVVYLEAYPKSKNRDLYPHIIDFDPNIDSILIPFIFFNGVGPKRLTYVYSLENKKKSGKFPPLLRSELPQYYAQKETDVISYIKNIISNKPNNSLEHLDELISHKCEIHFMKELPQELEFYSDSYIFITGKKNKKLYHIEGNMAKKIPIGNDRIFEEEFSSLSNGESKLISCNHFRKLIK